VPPLYRALSALGFRGFMRTLYRIELAGADRIPTGGPCILASNHESLLDPFFLGVVTPRTIRFMAKHDLWRHRPVGFFMNALGGFPIERGAGDAGGVRHGVTLLERGEVLAIFPQGTALPYRKRPFHRGAARLALVTGAPIVPVCMVGTERALRPSRVKVGLPRVKILVASPIHTEPAKPTVAASKALTQRIEDAITELRRPYGPPAHAWFDD
jgi:1-acyl-sn-glycerol-3-phosphate acyltransferase